ncbi:hypothetical protein PI124_g15434 [Phytophthora idaei]|nr:hypothetical protein PI125_g15144 [Phytophthora idaei]KAG3144088.1 hypothetical protein PI126_g14316 [Phytophthora idaei]KAG3239628.1 hypothetical protein PI124_g15434 [Phytophthora idaei]
MTDDNSITDDIGELRSSTTASTDTTTSTEDGEVDEKDISVSVKHSNQNVFGPTSTYLLS